MNQIVKTDRFSWHRVAEIAAYYSHLTRKQTYFYLALSLLFAVLQLLPFPEYVQVSLFTIIWTIIPLLFDLAPIGLAKAGDGRMVERMIPASTLEKFVYYMLFFLVFIPAVTYLLPELALWLYTKIPAVQTDGMMNLVSLHFENPCLILIMNIMTAVATSLTCLYVVMRSKTVRVLKGVLAVFAVKFAVGILGAFYGMAAVFKIGYEEGRTGKKLVTDSEEFAKELVDSMMDATPYMVTVTCIVGAYMILMFWLNYRSLKKNNL